MSFIRNKNLTLKRKEYFTEAKTAQMNSGFFLRGYG